MGATGRGSEQSAQEMGHRALRTVVPAEGAARGERVRRRPQGEVNAFVSALKATGITKMLRAELLVERAVAGKLYGSGMILVNPPYVLEDELKTILPALVKALGREGASHRLEWIRGEG